MSRSLIGPDLRGGFGRKMFAATNPAGLWRSLAVALGLLVFNQLMQVVCGLIIGYLVFGSMTGNTENFIDATLAGILPAALLTVPLAWRLARIKGGRPHDVLNLRWPDLRAGGWIILVGGFFVGLIVVFSIYLAIVKMTGHDTSTAGMVENALSGMARQPLLFLLAVPSMIIGAPLAEELIFRGQVFTALGQTRIGLLGATVLTSAAWSLLHYSGNWVLVSLIFMMGLAFGWMLRRFGSLWVTIVCHGAWNAATSLTIFTAIAS